MGLSFRIESNLIDGVGASHAVVKYRLIDNYMLGGQLLDGGPFFVGLGIV